jgi:hypothetical protein
MSELWGFQSGQSQRQADDQSKGLFNLRMAEGAIDLQTKQLTLDNARLMQTRQEQAIKLMQLAGGKPQATSGDNPTSDISNTLMDMARIDFASGLPEQGLAATKQAVALQVGHSKIVEQTTTDQIRKFSFLSNSLSEVHDQASWEQAKLIYQSNFPGQLDSRVANHPWTPEFGRQLMAGTQTALQKANAELAKARTDDVKVNGQLAELRKPMVVQQTRVFKDRADALEKNGGVDAVPKAAAIRRVQDLIVEAYPDIDKEDARTQATVVAQDAARRVAAGVSPLAADKQAFEANRKLFFGLKPARVRPGTKSSNPLPVPLKGGKPDPSQMVDNMIYDGKDLGHPGEAYAFDKARGGFVKVTKGDTSEEDPDGEPADE